VKNGLDKFHPGRKPNPLKTVMGMNLFESFPFTLKNLRLPSWQATVIVTGVQLVSGRET